MIDVVKNKRMNEALSELYFQYSDRYLNAYENIFEDKNLPKRINEFGIIDEERYDTDNGILFIAKETNDWSNEEIEKGYFFRQWLHRVSKEGVAWHYI